MESFFLITRENKDLLSYVYQAIKKDFKNKTNKDTKFLFYKPSTEINFFIIFEILKLVLSGNYFNNHKFVLSKIKNCNIGRYVLSTTYSNLETHFSTLSFNYFKLKFLIQGLNIIYFSTENQKRIAAIYIDHSVYINGLFLNFFSTKNTYVYTHNYPRGLFVKKFERKKHVTDFENFISLKKNKKKKAINQNKIKLFLLKKMKPNFSWPWLVEKNFNKNNNYDLNIKNYDCLIYCHAFTDAQLQCGYSGFIRYEDWLDYTLKILQKKNKKVLIKIHPNFTKYSKHFRAGYELKIFKRVKKKYNHNKNFKFIDEPYNNYSFLSKLNSKCLLISHHGTAIIEGALLGFKIISYRKGFWEGNFKITNTWNSISSYSKILKKEFSKLKLSNKKDFYYFVDKLIFNKYGTFGKKYFLKPIANYFKAKVSDLDDGLINLRNFNHNNKKDLKLIKNIMGCIENIE